MSSCIDCICGLCQECEAKDDEIKFLVDQLRLALDALDFYSQTERYQSKSKKIKPRIIQDSGQIARRTVQSLTIPG